MHFADRVLTCRDCSQAFVFPAAEARFYFEVGERERGPGGGWPAPVRCPRCRKQRARQFDRAPRADDWRGSGERWGSL